MMDAGSGELDRDEWSASHFGRFTLRDSTSKVVKRISFWIETVWWNCYFTLGSNGTPYILWNLVEFRR